MSTVSRAEAEALDGADPLAPLHERFSVPAGRIYLDGNSLGLVSADVRAGLAALVEKWGSHAVEAWDDWVELPTRIGDRLAATVLGARAGEVLVADSVTVNLYKLAHAAADHRPGPIVTDAANFPTDRYVLEGVARQRGREYVEAPHRSRPRWRRRRAACCAWPTSTIDPGAYSTFLPSPLRPMRSSSGT